MVSSNIRCEGSSCAGGGGHVDSSLLNEGTSTWAEIDLQAIKSNFKAITGHLRNYQREKPVEVFAAVKANAYGHGAIAVSLALVEAGASCLCVHRLSEGIELRKGGIEIPILVLGPTPHCAFEKLLEFDLIPSINNLQAVQHLSEIALTHCRGQMPIHMKIDTGMNRFGAKPEDALDLARSIIKLRGVKLQGVYTHFAAADALDTSITDRQLDVFNAVLESFNEARIDIPLRHAANSAALMRYPHSHFDAVRPGIALYGLLPTDQWKVPFEIQPAMSLKSRIVQIKQIAGNEGVSYGHTYISKHPMLVALIPLGYGDGYHRILSSKGQVLIRGVRAPILGRICMDQFVVDISHIPQAALEDEVVAIGDQGQESIRAEELALMGSTINYEITTGILPRVHRVYR